MTELDCVEHADGYGRSVRTIQPCAKIYSFGYINITQHMTINY